jgi:hypothetical protein
MFSTEYAVSYQRADGRCFSLFADKSTMRDVVASCGWLAVSVIERDNRTLALVRLPTETLEHGGRHITVNVSDLRFE